jgi:hypothetical protein
MVYHEDEEEDRCSSNESASPRASKTGFDLDDELLEETEDEDEEEDDDDDDEDEVVDRPESLRKSLPPSPPRRSAPGRSTSMCPSMFSRSAPARTSSSERMAELLGLPPRGGSRDSQQPPAPQRRAPARSYSARISATSSNARQPPSRQRSGDQLAQMLQMRPALSSTGSGSGSGGDDVDDDESAPVNRLACLQRQTSRRMMMDVAPSRPSRRVLASDPSEDSGDDDNSHLLDAAAAAPPMFSRRPPARSPSISRPAA